MNTFLEALNHTLGHDSPGLELISKGLNKLRGTFRGLVYENYSDLPSEARFALARCLQPYNSTYDSLARKFGPLEAEERLCWCLFGNLDGAVDVNVEKNTANIEVSSHCTVCQYGKPFCHRVLPGLTQRQQECIQLMRLGKTDKEVAQSLGISVHTVINHMTNAVGRIRDIKGSNVTRSFIINELTLAGV